MIVLAEVNAEEDIDQCRPQFADRNMRFSAQMNSLQRLKEPLPCANTYLLRFGSGQIVRTKDFRSPQDFTSLFCNAGLAGAQIS